LPSRLDRDVGDLQDHVDPYFTRPMSFAVPM